MTLHYLTVQDILWINLQITKRAQTFNYATLEEASYYQYSYGQSTDLIRQAGRLLSGFVKLKPFPEGNEATAFVACMAFLKINGGHCTLEDAKGADWARSAFGKGEQALDGMVETNEDHHEALAPHVREAVTEIVRDYPTTLAGLHASTAAA